MRIIYVIFWYLKQTKYIMLYSFLVLRKLLILRKTHVVLTIVSGDIISTRKMLETNKLQMETY